MGILERLYGKRKREKKERNRQRKERRKQEKKEQEKYEKMPDFKKLFASLPNIIKETIIPEEMEMQHVPSVHDRAVAKSTAEQVARTDAAKSKADTVFARMKTAKNKNLEIIWLLQADEDVPCKSVRELIESYRKVKDSDSFRGMSVNYAHKGKLYEISPLNEQDLEGLANKLEC